MKPIAFLFLVCLAVRAEAAMERVARIVDSRTIAVYRNGHEADVRLAGVVVPPAEEAAAVDYLRRELLGRWVLIEPDAALGDPWAFVYRSPDALFVNGAVAQRSWSFRTPMTYLGELDLGPRTAPSASSSAPAPRSRSRNGRRSAAPPRRAPRS